MKKGIHIGHGFLFRTIVLTGVLVGILAVSTAPHQNLSAHPSEQCAEPDESGEAVLKAFDAIASSTQITLNHEFLLINVLPDLEEEDPTEEKGEEQVLIGSKIFRILFQRIIAPNAP